MQLGGEYFAGGEVRSKRFGQQSFCRCPDLNSRLSGNANLIRGLIKRQLMEHVQFDHLSGTWVSGRKASDCVHDRREFDGWQTVPVRDYVRLQ
jgi:hypothetical protein